MHKLSLLAVVCLAGCMRAEPQAAIAATAAPLPRHATSLDCNDWAFIAEPIDAQWDVLQSAPAYGCEQIDAQGGALIDCTASSGLRAHGLAVVSMQINHPMGADQLQIGLVAAFDTAAIALAQAFGRPADIADQDQGMTWVGRHDDGRERRANLFTDSQGKLRLNCSIAAAADPDDGNDAQGPQYGDALVRALTHCEAIAFMSESPTARRQALAAAKLDCAAGTREGVHGMVCRMPAGARSWGDAAAETLFIGDRDGERYGIVRIAAPVRQVRSAIEASMQIPMTPVGDAGEARFEGGLDDMYRMRIAPRKDGKTDLHCAYAVADATDAGPGGTLNDRAAHAGGPFPQDDAEVHEDEHAIPPGSIRGAIRYPDDAAPAMRICAIHDQGAIHGCVETAAGARSYRIDNLPAADYVVIARTSTGALRAGGHVQQVQCIRAPCPEMPAQVFVAGGAELTDIDINGFYPAREDFPQMPVDD
jgi:hypothetical protein